MKDNNPIAATFRRLKRQGAAAVRAKEIRNASGYSYSEIYKWPKERPPKVKAYRYGKAVLFDIDSVIDYFEHGCRV
jgi:hypothetical protein